MPEVVGLACPPFQGDFSAICALALAGCASSGTKVSDEQAKQFQVGQTTHDEVVAALGPPTATSTAANGTRVIVYSYSSIRSRPENFIPYVGPLVASYDAKGSAVTFTFDGRGILANTNSTQTNTAVGTGFAASGQ